ncbi:triose-phosphate isomerase [Campylobacter sputorum]|uniref:triose-phosphate isomerase n=2 Tax=Campylobacter sputorum TaxID=206 RepID=UPI000B7760E0|nr:triose-phosphate isomerase [Campylobacter sputorum]ASM36401.1 triosephosphate isomerase [Campylobacter sputorum bv. faecalis CCUG 20703]
MIYAANFKCNHTRESFYNYANELNDILINSKIDDEIMVFPTSSSFLKNENLHFTQGAQNFYPCENGAYTGEIGKEQLDEFGINTVLIGHSERRTILKEDDSLLKDKFNFAMKNKFKIIYCIGESLEIYEDKKTEKFLEKQLSSIDLNYSNLIIAYEPVWAIGSGKIPSISDIKNILDFISTNTKAPLLYGGSVKKENIKSILDVKNCGGVLVGGASLKIQTFCELFI